VEAAAVVEAAVAVALKSLKKSPINANLRP
jgi:hypothetical protein